MPIRLVPTGFVLSALLLLAPGLAAPAQALSYSLVEADLPSCKGACPKVIVATGTIGQEEHLRLASFVDESRAAHRISSMLVIDSPGGFNIGAAYLGAVLRKLKMTVVVGRHGGGPLTAMSGFTPGVCASACVLVLAGGTSRYFVRGSKVGVHRSHTGPVMLDPTTRTALNGKLEHDDVKAAYARYFKGMGIDQSLAVLMDKTPSEQMYWLSPAELGKYRLARDAASSTRR